MFIYLVFNNLRARKSKNENSKQLDTLYFNSNQILFICLKKNYRVISSIVRRKKNENFIRNKHQNYSN